MSKEKKVKNQTAFLTYMADENGTIWLEAGWSPDDKSITQFAQMMYELHSGQLMGNTLEFIQEQCVSEEQEKEYRKILVQLNEFFFNTEHLNDLPFIEDHKPVVKPTQVFPQYGG